MKSILAWVVCLVAFACVCEIAHAGDEKKPARIRDVIYGRRDGMALTMDVFLPSGKPNGAALILVVSGGFHSSPETIAPAFNGEFLKRGYTIFTVVPCSAPRYTVIEMHEDLCRSVRFIRHHAKEYKVDPKRIGAGGASSGGLLSLLLATSPRPGNSKSNDPVEREDSSVQSTANFFPPTDFLNYGEKGKEFLNVKDHGVPYRAAFDFRAFNGKEGLFESVTEKDKLRAIYREISPIYHISAKTPPVFLVHGKTDNLVPIQQSRTFIEKLKEAKVLARLEERNAGHGWLTILSELPAMADWHDEHLKSNK